jgi:hypothetical protein
MCVQEELRGPAQNLRGLDPSPPPLSSRCAWRTSESVEEARRDVNGIGVGGALSHLVHLHGSPAEIEAGAAATPGCLRGRARLLSGSATHVLSASAVHGSVFCLRKFL